MPEKKAGLSGNFRIGLPDAPLAEVLTIKMLALTLLTDFFELVIGMTVNYFNLPLAIGASFSDDWLGVHQIPPSAVKVLALSFYILAQSAVYLSKLSR